MEILNEFCTESWPVAEGCGMGQGWEYCWGGINWFHSKWFNVRQDFSGWGWRQVGGQRILQWGDAKTWDLRKGSGNGDTLVDRGGTRVVTWWSGMAEALEQKLGTCFQILDIHYLPGSGLSSSAFVKWSRKMEFSKEDQLGKSCMFYIFLWSYPAVLWVSCLCLLLVFYPFYCRKGELKRDLGTEIPFRGKAFIVH